MSDQLRDALTLAQEKRDRADVEHRLAALLHELASGADFACPRPRRLALHPRTTEKSFSAPAAPTANQGGRSRRVTIATLPFSFFSLSSAALIFLLH